MNVRIKRKIENNRMTPMISFCFIVECNLAAQNSFMLFLINAMNEILMMFQVSDQTKVIKILISS
jgi:hypothetical protein